MMKSYLEGEAAALAGSAFWENPYVQPKSEINDTQAWFAGWCMGTQIAHKERAAGAVSPRLVDQVVTVPAGQKTEGQK